MKWSGAKTLLVVSVFLAGLGLGVVPGLGANQAVTAGGTSNSFRPGTVTVAAGESVTWTNAGGSHNVKFDDGAFEQPAAPSSSAWTVSRTFTTAGTYRYYCELHGGAGGAGMSGTVVVTSPAGTTTGPSPYPGGGGGGSPGAGPGAGTLGDTTAPKVAVVLGRTQRILRRRGLVVTVQANESATVSAAARITVPGASRVLRLRKVSRKLAAGVSAKLKLRLSRKARVSVASAFTRSSRLRAKVTVAAIDAAGNRRSVSRSLKVTK